MIELYHVAVLELPRVAIGLAILLLCILALAVLAVGLSQREHRLKAAEAAIARERALHAAEKQIHAIFAQAAVGMAVLDPEWRAVRVNQHLCDMLLYSEGDLLGRDALSVTHPADVATYANALRRLKSGEADSVHFQKRCVRRNGEPLWTGVDIRIVHDSSGEPDYYIVVLVDIDARKRTEEQLRASEARFRTVFEASSTAQLVIDGTRTVRMANAQAQGLYGWSANEMIGQSSTKLSPSWRHDSNWAVEKNFFDDPVRMHFGPEYGAWALRKDGIELPTEFFLTPLEIDGETMALVSVIDLTDHLAREAALRESEDQLRRAQKMEAIGNLTGGIAHDFNNLLGVIIANLDLACPFARANSEQEELITEALNAAVHGADLTRRLLAFARRQPLRPQRVELNGLISDLVRLLSRALGEDIRIELQLSDDLWPVLIDPAQFESALVNLAMNSRDAMPSGGVLCVSSSNSRLDASSPTIGTDLRPDDYVLIEVNDTGLGMTPEVRERIFEPFFTTKEAGKGTGLGLSMVFGFIKQSGGHVEVRSEPKKGATFRLYLPRLLEHSTRPLKQATPQTPRGSGERVLVVEDNAPLRRAVVRQLTEIGYSPLAAPNAKEAIEWLERSQFALVLTDIVMPGGMNGFALANEVSSRWPDVRVVFMSGYAGSVSDTDGADWLRRCTLLIKPFQRGTLSQAIHEALREVVSEPASTDAS